jgi:hypothetical protein
MRPCVGTQHPQIASQGLLALAIALLAISCERRPEPAPEVAGRPECPGAGFAVRVDTGEHALPALITQIPFVDPITDIPEFHDCQRFITRDGAYGDRYAIFATAKLDSLALGWEEDSAANAATRVRRLAAVIYSWGGTYQPLGIGPGFNCLYMYRANRQWQASMHHLPANQYVCDDVVLGPPPPADKGLEVHQASGAGPGYIETDYPPVARWDWDPDSLEQYISIKCAPVWCEIGDAGFRPSQVVTATTSFPPNEPGVPGEVTLPTTRRRTAEIRGWYDYQQLAVATGTGSIRPSPVFGRLYPHKTLFQRNLLSDFSNPVQRWVPVAYAVVDADYQSRLRFDRGMNRIALCVGTREFCQIPAGTPMPASCTAASGWWAKIESRPTLPRYTCVTRRDHSGLGITIPGVARWRWDEDDESVWIRCLEGCCELE